MLICRVPVHLNQHNQVFKYIYTMPKTHAENRRDVCACCVNTCGLKAHRNVTATWEIELKKLMPQYDMKDNRY